MKQHLMRSLNFGMNIVQVIYIGMRSLSIVWGYYGVCVIDAAIKGEFKYLIAAPYEESEQVIPKGLQVISIPSLTWAKFRAVGSMPQAIQNLNLRIFKEWRPSNPNYEISEGYNIEVYTISDVKNTDYISEIWIPVKWK